MSGEEATPDLQPNRVGDAEEAAGEEYGQERQAAERVIDQKAPPIPQNWKDVIYPPPQSQATKPVIGEAPQKPEVLPINPERRGNPLNREDEVSGTIATPDKGMRRDLQKGKRIFKDSLGLPADEQGNPVDEHGEPIDHEEE